MNSRKASRGPTAARACLLRFAAQVRASASVAPDHPAVRRALDLIAADYRRLRTTEELARRTGMSTTRLRVLFRQAGQESPGPRSGGSKWRGRSSSSAPPA